MKWFLAGSLLGTLVLACASEPKAVRGPHGRQAFTVKCGSGQVESCYNKAADVCPYGYDIVDRERQGDTVSRYDTRYGEQTTVTPGGLSLLVECT